MYYMYYIYIHHIFYVFEPLTHRPGGAVSPVQVSGKVKAPHGRHILQVNRLRRSTENLTSSRFIVLAGKPQERKN
jgi:hypothetical protein